MAVRMELRDRAAGPSEFGPKAPSSPATAFTLTAK